MDLVALFASEQDAMGSAIDYLEAIHLTAGGAPRKRARVDDPYGSMGYPMATLAGAPYMLAPQMPSKTPKGAPIEGVDGNWRCPACTNINFGVRDTCNRCKAVKPSTLQTVRTASSARQARMGHPPQNPPHQKGQLRVTGRTATGGVPRVPTSTSPSGLTAIAAKRRNQRRRWG